MHFEKVSLKQFVRDYLKCKYGNSNFDLSDDDEFELRRIYDSIKLPRRSTKHSAGYDFFLPYTTEFKHRGEVTLPTGIRFNCDDDKYLMLVPRSGLGFKYSMRLANSTGVIDSDYYYSDNQGHIMAKITCDYPFVLDEGKAFMQGIISQYFKVDDDTTQEERNGGFGSTGM